MQYESLSRYFGNAAIRQAVDALVEKLDGKKPPDLTWKHAQQYNCALLMAAQVRSDFIKMMFDVWERTFGEAFRSKFSNYCEDHWESDSGYYSPAPVWDDEEIGRVYYRDNIPDEGGRHEEFYVEIHNRRLLSLRVYRFRDEKRRIHFKDHQFESWEIQCSKYVEQSNFATTAPIPISELILELGGRSKSHKRLVELRDAAFEMIAYLVDH